MKRYIQTIGILFYLLLFPLSLAAITVQSYSIGSQQGWDADITRNNISIVSDGYMRPILQLSPSDLNIDRQTDLFLDFDKHASRDASGNFVIDPSSKYEISASIKKHGSASVLIYPDSVIKLQALQTRVFAPSQVWGDVSIEFWYYPLTVRDGQRIFSWEGSYSHNGGTSYQSINIHIEKGRMVWEFNNIFTDPETMEAIPVVVSAHTMLLPKQWRYHSLRYDSDAARLEYSMDMGLDTIVYTTANGHPEGKQVFPQIASNNASSFHIGGNKMMGLLDNFLISSATIRENAALLQAQEYSPMALIANQGSVISSPIDTGSLGASMSMLQADYKTPGASTLSFYYRTADTVISQSPEAALAAEWVYFNPNAPFPGTVESRFIQFKVVFLPDPELQASPEIKSMTLYYYRNEPVFPPTFLRAVPREGAVFLEWEPIHDSTLAGYQVYYGTKKNNFLGRGSTLGDSPIFVGEGTSLLVEGLSADTLYYFAVSSVSKYGQVYGKNISFSPVATVYPLEARKAPRSDFQQQISTNRRQ